jgi:hypothetical protein
MVHTLKENEMTKTETFILKFIKDFGSLTLYKRESCREYKTFRQMEKELSNFFKVTESENYITIKFK